MKIEQGEVRPAFDLEQIAVETHRKFIALEDAIRATKRGETEVGKLRDVEAQRRLELGRSLAIARKLWPERGPRAAGWGEFLSVRVGIEQQRALELMKYAGYVEKISPPSEVHGGEISTPKRLPTYEEAGIKKRDWKPTPTDDEIEEVRVKGAERREQERLTALAPLRMETRETNTDRLIARLLVIHTEVLALRKENLHLTDATVSPEEFQRAKHLWFDVVRAGLDDLEAAGQLDKSDDQMPKKHQLKLV